MGEEVTCLHSAYIHFCTCCDTAAARQPGKPGKAAQIELAGRFDPVESSDKPMGWKLQAAID